jgi:hypothetical protein
MDSDHALFEVDGFTIATARTQEWHWYHAGLCNFYIDWLYMACTAFWVAVHRVHTGPSCVLVIYKFMLCHVPVRLFLCPVSVGFVFDSQKMIKGRRLHPPTVVSP